MKHQIKNLIQSFRQKLSHQFRGNVNLEPSNIQLVDSLEELDIFLHKTDAASNDDDLRQIFKEFQMPYPTNLPADPHSEAYRNIQFDFYEYVAGKPYGIENEVSIFDLEHATRQPFPFYTASPGTVGNQLIAIGHLIKTLNLPENSSILEFGPGWGNTTIFLARMGYNMTAIDIEQRFIDLIHRRAEQKKLQVETILEDFQFVHKTDRQWDAVLFFECFHHCSDHRTLIQGLDNVVAPDGKVMFAAEPITDAFPIPWGFRRDGESLWAIRNFGWCELGFQETYFRDLLKQNGWSLSKHVCVDTPWGTVFVAQRI